MRTIVDLPERQIRALAEVCAREGISRAEAVRRAVSNWLEQDRKTHPRGWPDEAFGSWTIAEGSVDYVRRLRNE